MTDSDGDGVEDSLDQCPNTTTGTTVDSTGCKITDNPSKEETTDNKSEKEESGSLPGFSVIIGLLSILLAATISRFEK